MVIFERPIHESHINEAEKWAISLSVLPVCKLFIVHPKNCMSKAQRLACLCLDGENSLGKK